MSSRPSLYNTQIQTEVPIQPNSTKKLGQPSRVSPKIIGSGLPALLQIDQYLPQEGSRDTFPRRHSRKNRNSHSPVLYYHKPSVSTFFRQSSLYNLGLTLWNLSCLEFKFDDTRLSYWHKNKIGRIEIFFCCFLTLLIFCPVSWVSFAETSQQGRKLAKSGSNKKNFQFCQSYSYVNRKVWYHQIWIPSNLCFIVSDLMEVPLIWITVRYIQKNEVQCSPTYFLLWYPKTSQKILIDYDKKL